MIGRVGDGAHDGDNISVAVVRRRGLIERPSRALLDGLVCVDARNHGRGGIHDVYRLAAARGIAADVGCLPGAGGIECAVAVTGDVSYRGDHRYDVRAAIVSSCWNIEVPSTAKFDGLVAVGASNHWRSRIQHVHFLAASSGITAAVSRFPGPSGIECAIAMTSGIGNGTNNANGIGSAVIGSGWRIEKPCGS